MLPKLFASIEQTMLARFREAGFIKHAGDKGENREHILRDFLANHLPKKYGVAKGEIVTKDGQHSHSADIVIYDAVNCPILYSEKTAIIPIEGVFGVIEVKSSLSKAEFVGAARQIESFKKLAPRELGVPLVAGRRKNAAPFSLVVMPLETADWTCIRPGRIVAICSLSSRLSCSRSNGRSIGMRTSGASLPRTSLSFPTPVTWCLNLVVSERSAGGGRAPASPEVFALSTSRVPPRVKSYY